MPRPKILVFQHVPYEPLGTLDPLLKAAGFRIRYVNFSREPHMPVELDRYAAVIALGGPMNVDETERYPNLKREVDILREALERDMSVLGICLGAQLLAKALGGRVYRNDRKEIGWHDVHLTHNGRMDPVLSTFEHQQEVFHWHVDGIELPSGCRHLASSERSEVQAFAFGEHAYGLQFHLEVNEPLVHRWLRVPENQPVLTDPDDAIEPEAILEHTPKKISALEALSNDTFSRWIERFDIPPRRVSLPSR
ncbi:MAG: type 1 glutamine amidotransferase [Woeseiaceae bacterium]|nr:type 1 glutamine amidotransferase [Woeseiaceae bacterium]